MAKNLIFGTRPAVGGLGAMPTRRRARGLKTGLQAWLRPLAAATAISTSAAANPIYVDAGAAGATDGSTWADAYNDLQDALTAANMRNADADPNNDVSEIWVAAGTYMPDGGYKPVGGAHVPGTGDRTATFQLINGVALYGGFAGGESALSERDVAANETILSGDLAGDDKPVACTQDSPDCDSFGSLCGDDGFCIISENNDENSYHIVTGGGTDATAVLDGFSITAGNADGAFPQTVGAGLAIDGGNPTVNDCTISRNRALSSGGGIYANMSDPSLINSTFTANWAFVGGGIYNLNSGPAINGCTFHGNAASSSGGGMYNHASSPMVIHSTFRNNVAGGTGGGMRNTSSSSPTVSDCNFSENIARLSSGGGMQNSFSSNPTVTNCAFCANLAGFDGAGGASGGGIDNVNECSPTVTDSTFSGNAANSWGGGMSNGLSSNPTVTNCAFNGNSSTFAGAGMVHLDSSNPTVTNCAFSGNSADRFGGGMAVWSDSDPTVTNCTFSGNVAGINGGGIYNTGASSNPTLANSIFWNNSDSTGSGASAQVHVQSGAPAVNYCIVQGGWSGAGGIGVLTANPLFVDADGPDDISGTEDDDLHLDVCSPAIDVGDNSTVPAEIITDLDGDPRIVDGNGTGIATVDMGAFEFQSLSICGFICGNGLLDPGEECDDGPDNSDTTPDVCRTDCTLPRCGDSVVDTGEECDGTNDTACFGPCRSDCTCQCITVDAVVKVDGVPTDIGDITACVEVPSDPPPPHTMTVDFEIDPKFTDLCDEVEFHWLQVVIDDDCPPPSAVTGAPAGTPYVDPPDGGYVGEMWDTLPWYDQIGADWCMCHDCFTIDTKSVCAQPSPWAIRFRTWLVAHEPGTMEFCLIAGFEWARTDPESGEISGPTDLGTPTPAHVFQANAALANPDSGFATWTANRQCELPPCVSEVLETNEPGLACQATAKLTDAPGQVINGVAVRNGLSVDFQGDTVIMGGALDIDQAAERVTGAAYIFVRGNDGVWTQQAKLTASPPLQFDFFGSSVAVDGDTAVVGSLIPHFDENGEVVDTSGAVYVFVRSNGVWTRQEKLNLPDPPANQILAYLTVATEGDTVVVGALSLELGDAGPVGWSVLVYVFVRTGEAWTLEAPLAPFDPSTVPFGVWVSVDADTVVIGGDVDIDIDAQTATGVTHVFVRNNGEWTQQAMLTACDVSPFSAGGSVAIDGDTIVVGHSEFEIGEQGLPFQSSVSARMFTRTGQLWTEEAKFILPSLDPLRFFPFGVTVAVSQNTVAVDQTFLEVDENGTPVSSTSSVSVLTRVGDVWAKQRDLPSPDPLGASVEIDDNTIAVGGLNTILDADNVPISVIGSVDVFDCLPSVIDLEFFAPLPQCMGGSGTLPPESCPDSASMDLDRDGDIDLRDFGLIQLRFTGPGP